jgi:Sulfotransferase domain
MRVLGVGLSRTGTLSLHRAFELLNFKSIHYDQIRLTDILDGSNTRPNFRRYDDVDAVTDLPAAYFYREILEAYPDCKAVLTTRDVESWWHSWERHNAQDPVVPPSAGQQMLALVSPTTAARLKRHRFKTYVRNYVYGSALPREFLYKKKFAEYYQRVTNDIPADRLLAMNIIGGDGWERLCPFLGVPIPSVPFPHENRTAGKLTPGPQEQTVESSRKEAVRVSAR